jgi:hypothetical protein
LALAGKQLRPKISAEIRGLMRRLAQDNPDLGSAQDPYRTGSSNFVQHTSASLTIQENADPDVIHDLNAFFSRLVAEHNRLYRHTIEGPDGMPAHIRPALTLTAPIDPDRARPHGARHMARGVSLRAPRRTAPAERGSPRDRRKRKLGNIAGMRPRPPGRRVGSDGTRLAFSGSWTTHVPQPDEPLSNRESKVDSSESRPRTRGAKINSHWQRIGMAGALLGLMGAFLTRQRGGAANTGHQPPPPSSQNDGSTPARRGQTQNDTAGKKGTGAVPAVGARAHKGSSGVYYSGPGTVTPIDTVRVRSCVDGQLNLYYREGDMVRAGDLLVELDTRPESTPPPIGSEA